MRWEATSEPGRWRAVNVQSGCGTPLSSSPMRKSRLKPPPGREVPLALLSSPSRGLDNDGDSTQNLTQPNTQERFSEYIATAISKHAQFYGTLRAPASRLFPVRLPDEAIQHGATGLESGTPALQSLQDILLLVRRLREGLVASSRTDELARRVYVLSMVLSILIGDSIQLTASLGRLVRLLDADTLIVCPELADLLPCEESTFSSDIIRSLLLLWISVTGGQTERLGGSDKKQMAGSSPTFWTTLASLPTIQGAHVQFVIRAHRALASNDVLRIRAILLESSKHIFHRALLSRVVEQKREKSWNVLIKAYLHAAADASLLGHDEMSWPTRCGPNDWLEQVLLIDVKLVPPPDRVNQRGIPDSWDEEVSQLEADLKRSHIHDPHPLVNVRRKRLADTLAYYRLGEDPSSQANEADRYRELARWSGRLSRQNGVPVIKLR